MEQTATARDEELLANDVLTIREGGVIRIDSDNGFCTTCVSPRLSRVIADAIEAHIGMRLVRNKDGSLSYRTIAPTE